MRIQGLRVWVGVDARPSRLGEAPDREAGFSSDSLSFQKTGVLANRAQESVDLEAARVTEAGARPLASAPRRLVRTNRSRSSLRNPLKGGQALDPFQPAGRTRRVSGRAEQRCSAPWASILQSAPRPL